MRAVGYSLSTAIADVVDNSIAAKATTINVLFDGSVEHPYVAVLDNGEGMDAKTARRAMQLAGTNATEQRDAADLGRFGLGLKTASLSQCRHLTLITKQGASVVGLTWNLDVIEDTGRWTLIVHEHEELVSMPHFGELQELEHGTLVLWTELDRLLREEHDKGRYMDSQMELVREHLSLVFHRFITGDVGRATKIQLNHVEIVGVDPFLSTSKGTQKGPCEDLLVGESIVVVQPFTLPFLNKMSKKERTIATANGSLRDSQGFYVYRAGRLVVWGTWFRLTPKNEMGRLTRVRVDIPNSLDHLWSLDIKKSAAVPPTVVRNRLKELAARFVEPSERIHRYRGRKPGEHDPVVRAWAVVIDRDAVRYEINRRHPALQQLADALGPTEMNVLESALEIVESTFPVNDVFNRMSSDTPVEQFVSAPETLLEALLQLWALDERQTDAGGFVDFMTKSEPFNVIVDYRDQFLERASQVNKGHSE